MLKIQMIFKIHFKTIQLRIIFNIKLTLNLKRFYCFRGSTTCFILFKYTFFLGHLFLTILNSERRVAYYLSTDSTCQQRQISESVNKHFG